MMKKTVLTLVIITIALLLNSCFKKEDQKNETESKKFSKLEEVKWLIGSWGNTSKEGNLTETWTQKNDSTLSGKTTFIAVKDTLFTETIEIIQTKDSLFYNTNVSNQNEGKTISFKLTNTSENEIIFENSKHDFPQKIMYKKIDIDSLVAKISGKKDGKESFEEYPMKKK